MMFKKKFFGHKMHYRSKVPLYEIVSKLGLPDLNSLCLTTKNYHKICLDDHFGNSNFIENLESIKGINLSYKELYIYSFGQT